jgi:hypothetical protein
MHNNLRATTGILISNIKFIIPGFQKYMSPHRHIILIPSLQFALSPECCVLSGEATNTN